MSEINPYAPPSEEQAPSKKKKRKRARVDDHVGAWREGDCMLVERMDAELPDRCVVCNAPANGYKLRQTLLWHPAWIYMLIFMGLLPYLIGASLTRKTGTVNLGLCEQHRKRRNDGITMAWGGFALGFVLLLVLILSSAGVPLLIPILIMIGLPIVGQRVARVAALKRIDGYYMWLKVGWPFLNSLPDASER